MSSQSLGRLKKVNLREAWASEAFDFTPWLAADDNLQLLSETIGIELELESQEKEVGPFRADLLCKDTATDDWVLIENQLEKTDHLHLGQLLTYAAGLKAVTIVWVAEKFTEEHRAALDWLNERTDEKIQLFGLEIELWRIGDSPFAPKFNIISKPNDWQRMVQKEAIKSAELSETQQLQLRFWSAFREHMETKKSFVRCQKPFPSSWTNHPLGKSGIHLASIISTRDWETRSSEPEIRAEVYMKGANAKQHFAILFNQKDLIEAQLGFGLTWRNPDDKAMCRMYTRLKCDFTDSEQWPECFEWLRQRQETLHRVFSPLVRNLNA